MLFPRNISDMGDHIFGWHNTSIVNGAVLRLPRDSFLARMCERYGNN